MKKIIITILFFIGIIVNAALVDGTYYVEKGYNNNWKPFGKIIVKGNKIIGIQYDKKDTNGNLLSLDQEENAKYRANYGESFRDMSFKLSRNLVNVQNINEVVEIKDTKSFNEFKEMMEYLIDKANNGETGEYKIQ